MTKEQMEESQSSSEKELIVDKYLETIISRTETVKDEADDDYQPSAKSPSMSTSANQKRPEIPTTPTSNSKRNQTQH